MDLSRIGPAMAEPTRVERAAADVSFIVAEVAGLGGFGGAIL